jgi:hypothetical protein
MTDNHDPAAESSSNQPYTFAFVVNIGRLVGEESFEIAPSLVLRRAAPDERQIIKAHLGGSPLPLMLTANRGYWELQRQDGGKLEPIPEEDQRYFVLALEGFSDWLYRVQEACDLGPLELEVGLIVHISGAPGFSTQFHPARLFHVMEQAVGNDAFFLDVSADDVQATRRIAEQLAQHDHTVVDLRPLIAQLRSLKALQHQSALRFLGYFAVLEALLTHAPKPTDPYESITRQVKQKVALLNHRWKTPLDYTPFGNSPSHTIWTAMYYYRSKLAHGGNVDFTDGKLRVLGSHERALKLLIETVKATMRHALDDPRLLIDLREC